MTRGNQNKEEGQLIPTQNNELEFESVEGNRERKSDWLMGNKRNRKMEGNQSI